jgi:hypothetical protein
MDDFVISNLHESRNEWCSRLVSILSPLVVEGFKSIFNESWKMCIDNDELNKYLMTFQELLKSIPKWNNEIIGEERKRIIERSGCNYLEDLITCVHIIQLKVLTCIRVGNKQKKIDISTPKLDEFIHKVYIHCARKIYSNVYLFEKNISPLQIQKNNRELEVIIQECILIAIRDSIPTESIIRAYMDEAVEEEEHVFIESIPNNEMKPSYGSLETMENKEVVEEKPHINEIVEPGKTPEQVLGIKNADDETPVTRLTFNDMDSVLDESNNVKNVEAPKTIERLEEISMNRALEDKLNSQDPDDIEDELKIGEELIDLNDFEDLNPVKKSEPSLDDIILDGVEELS